jgi:hypothetical protein
MDQFLFFLSKNPAWIELVDSQLLLTRYTKFWTRAVLVTAGPRQLAENALSVEVLPSGSGGMVCLPNFWMDSAVDLGGRRVDAFATEVKSICFLYAARPF